MSPDRSPVASRSIPSCLLPLAALAVAIAYVATAQGFGAASREVPQLVGAVTALLCLLDALSRTDTRPGRAVARWLNPAGPGEVALMHRHRQAVAVAGIALLAIAMVLVGIIPAVTLFGLLALRFRAGRGWAASVAAGVAVAAAIWVLFGVVLGLRLFPGLLFGSSW